jgi:hypothetical protein
MVAVSAHAYNDNHRNLPTPRMQKQLPGQPAPDLSWRVDLLPFAGNGALYNQFDKAQGFDQGKNKDLQTRMPSIYLLHGESGFKDTKFQYFTGPKTLFPDEKYKRTLGQITDGTVNTILFAQSSTSVVWSKHADMTIQGGAAVASRQVRGRHVRRQRAHDRPQECVGRDVAFVDRSDGWPSTPAGLG